MSERAHTQSHDPLFPSAVLAGDTADAPLPSGKTRRRLNMEADCIAGELAVLWPRMTPLEHAAVNRLIGLVVRRMSRDQVPAHLTVGVTASEWVRRRQSSQVRTRRHAIG